MVAECSGKVTTVEMVVPDGRAAVFGRSGILVVSARQLAKIRTYVAAIENGALAGALIERHLVKPTVVAKSLATVAKQIAGLREHLTALEGSAL
jgi:hypothetical protein